MRKSVLQRRMGLEGVKLGLSEYLSGNAEVGQVIYDVGIPNMHVLFSGKLVTNASALLSAKWLRTLCDSVKDSYDYIIFDTPPVVSSVMQQLFLLFVMEHFLLLKMVLQRRKRCVKSQLNWKR